MDGTQVKKDQEFTKRGERGLVRRETTKGWEIFVQWNDGSTTWEALKDMKECYPVQVAEYAVLKQISK